MRHLLLIAVLLTATSPVQGQPVADTLFSWLDYGRTSSCRVQIFQTLDDKNRHHTVVLGELAQNRGATTVSDARHLVELVGRRFNIDPAAAYWIFHWGSFSFEGAETHKKEILLRATFSRQSGGRLAAPSWRILTRDEVEDMTDRLFR
jgi:hypothetical protein